MLKAVCSSAKITNVGLGVLGPCAR